MEIADMGFEPMYLPYEGSEEPLLRNPRYKIDYCELAVYQGDTFL